MLKINVLLFAVVGALSACEKPYGSAPPEDESAFDIAPSRVQLQKARDLEKKIQQEDEEHRRKIKLQTD